MMLTDAAKEQWTAKISDTLVCEWVRTERLITNHCFIERKTFHPFIDLTFMCVVFALICFSILIKKD